MLRGWQAQNAAQRYVVVEPVLDVEGAERHAGADSLPRDLAPEVVVLDGGIHHVLRPALVGQEHRVRRVGRGPDGPSRFAPVTIAVRSVDTPSVDSTQSSVSGRAQRAR